jgi:hypothetical protein
MIENSNVPISIYISPGTQLRSLNRNKKVDIVSHDDLSECVFLFLIIGILPPVMILLLWLYNNFLQTPDRCVVTMRDIV